MLPLTSTQTPIAIPSHVLDGLAATGTAFVRALYAEFEPSPSEAFLVRAMAVAQDAAEDAHARNDDKNARAWYRTVSSTWALLQRERTT